MSRRGGLRFQRYDSGNGRRPCSHRHYRQRNGGVARDKREERDSRDV